MPTVVLRLPPEPESVGAARRALRDQLAAWGADELDFVATQALTELATNAVIHAHTEFTVTIVWSGDLLRVAVQDGSLKLPRQRGYAVDATTGRGLALVDRLCQSWGVDRDGAGKTVWFEVAEGVEADDSGLDAESLLAAYGDDGDIASPELGVRAMLALAA